MDGTVKYVNLRTGPGVATLPPGNSIGDVLAWTGVEWAPLAISALIRSAHADATAGQDCDLVWDFPFNDDVVYSPMINGFEASGAPVEIQLISISKTKAVVKTFVDCRIYAIAK